MKQRSWVLIALVVALLGLLLTLNKRTDISLSILSDTATSLEQDIQNIFLSKSRDSPIGCIIKCKDSIYNVEDCEWERKVITNYAKKILHIPEKCILLNTDPQKTSGNRLCSILPTAISIEHALKFHDEYETLLDDSTSSANEYIVFILVPHGKRNKVDSFTSRFLQRIDFTIRSQ